MRRTEKLKERRRRRGVSYSGERKQTHVYRIEFEAGKRRDTGQPVVLINNRERRKQIDFFGCSSSDTMDMYEEIFNGILLII